ncbi:MAG TPA: PAS domain S-box protein [Longimicrobiales bacterium]|nr:PAS domain S-box protein [Longimicrobiales bacterium]
MEADSGPATGTPVPTSVGVDDGWDASAEKDRRHGLEMVIVLSRSGAVLDVNHAALEFTGWQRGAVIGRPPRLASVSPETRARLRAAMARVAAGHDVSMLERIPDIAGRHRLLEISLSPLTLHGTTTGLLVLVARDVTEAAAAHRELVASREKYFGIVNIAADAIISVDEDYRITDFNRGAEQIFGYTAAEMTGCSLDVLIPHRFRRAHVQHVRVFGRSAGNARRMGERSEISALRKGGEEFAAEASISKQVADGKPFYTVVLRDTTRQKRAERSQRLLARAGSLLASSLDVSTTLESIAQLATNDAMADCCVIFDASEDHVVRRAALASTNVGFSSMLEEHRGESLSLESVHPVSRVLKAGLPLLIADTRELLRANGNDRDLSLMRELDVKSTVIVPLLARGRTSGAIALYRTSADGVFGEADMALAEELAAVSALAVDNARLYESARRAIRARDDVLAVVSHDLGNPLAAVRIGTTVLASALTDMHLPETILEHLRGVRKSVDQMDRLIGDLMDVERMDTAGPLALGAKPVRAATVISSVMEMFNVIAAAKQVSLHSRVPVSVPTIRADRDRLVQALSNLVGNAIKFTQPLGAVEIAVELVDHSLLFSVTDDGPGIDPTDLEHVFDRFWRASRGERGATGGLGLGLAIVKGIIEAHGGRVWAESELGAGTRMRFTVPLSGPRSSAPPRRRTGTSPYRRPIDQNPDSH